MNEDKCIFHFPNICYPHTFIIYVRSWVQFTYTVYFHELQPETQLNSIISTLNDQQIRAEESPVCFLTSFIPEFYNFWPLSSLFA